MSTVRPLNDALKKIAQEELKEVENRLPKDIAALKLWIEQQPHLRARIDDQYLLAFLRGSKYSLERAKSRIDYFYTIKSMLPEFFHNRRLNENILEFAGKGIYTWSVNPSKPDSPNIAIVRFQNFDVNTCKLIDIFRYRMFALEHYLNDDDNCVVAGYVEIVDLAKIPFSLYTQIDLTLFKKLGVFGEKALPIRYKGLHLLNFKTEYTEIFRFVNSLLVPKYRERLHVHKTLEELYEHVPRDSLPKEYGGTNDTISGIANQNIQQLLALKDFFMEDENYGVDENLRPNNQPFNINSLFGLEGSFRKLEID